MSELIPNQPSASSAGSFIAGGRTVEAARGWDWIVSGFESFKKDPGIWIALVVLWLVGFAVLNFMPVIGSLAGMLLTQVVLGGVMLGCRDLENGQKLQIEHLLAGFKEDAGRLVVLGVLAAVGWIVVLIIPAVIIGGGGAMAVLGGHAGGLGLAAMGFSFMLAALVGLALSVPLYMAIWYAPALIVFHQMAPVDALKASFGACLKNMVPFLIYGVILLALSVVAAIPFGLGFLVLAPVILASIYTSYRDIFFAG
jgi:hypothetical protein